MTNYLPKSVITLVAADGMISNEADAYRSAVRLPILTYNLQQQNNTIIQDITREYKKTIYTRMVQNLILSTRLPYLNINLE